MAKFLTEQLFQTVPPLRKPADELSRYREMWSTIEDTLSFSLPDDYKLIVEQYGSGKFGNYVWLHNPFSYGSAAKFIYEISRFPVTIEADKQMYEEDHLPYSLYPFGNVVVLGGTDRSGSICWFCDSKGDHIISVDADFSSEFGLYDLSLSEFILNWVNADIAPYNFPEGTTDYGDRSIFYSSSMLANQELFPRVR